MFLGAELGRWPMTRPRSPGDRLCLLASPGPQLLRVRHRYTRWPAGEADFRLRFEFLHHTEGNAVAIGDLFAGDLIPVVGK